MTVDGIVTDVAWIGIACLATNLSLFAGTQWLHAMTHGPRPDVVLRMPRMSRGRDVPVPFISIHVPCYDEPPEIVSETLRSLASLDYPAYEVILLDNNTPSEKSWRPIERLCGLLGPRFRFVHVDGLSGAKAGALNLCLALSDPRSAYIAVVDADYQVDRDFLTIAMDHVHASKAAFVQFPQAFRGAAGASEAVALELEDYFSVLARQAPEIRTPLLTGTLSVISKACLRDAGGWSPISVTEDAELGVRLFAAGHLGSFCDRIVGRGLLPMSIEGLKIQRRRWVMGNMQTLGAAFRDSSLNERAGAASVMAQLSAWPAFWLAPIAVLLLGVLIPESDQRVDFAVALAATTILLSVGVAAARGLVNRKRELPISRGVVGPLAVKLALVWVSSSAWLEPLVAAQIRFVKTPKSSSTAKSPQAGAILALACLIGAFIYGQRGAGLAAVACGVAALSWPAARWVDAGLRQYGDRQACQGARVLEPRNCTV